MTLTRHELDILHKFSWHPLRLLMQAIRVKLNLKVAVILDESNPNHL